MNNRLQFRQHDAIFNTRDEAIEYIYRGVKFAEEGLASVDVSYGLSLFGEPTVLRYKNVTEQDPAGENDPHLMLVIGSVTNEDQGRRHSKNRFCVIDIDKTESEIEDLKDELERAISMLRIFTKDTDTLELHSEVTESGTVLSGDVRVAEYQVFDRVPKDNIIMATEDGLFTFVGLEYDDNTCTFTFTVNGDSTQFVAKGNQITGGTYSPEDESLHIFTRFGDEISILLEDLIDEWTVEGEATKSPIVLTRKEVGYGDDPEHHHVEPWQDVLSADVRIADDRVNNILKKTTDNRYLYVDGVATNIVYYSPSGKSNVQAALDELADVKPSTDSNNIITKKADGFFASTKLEYISNENTLVFTTSTNDEDERKRETKIKLNSFSVFENIVYDPVKESLIITYIDGNGDTKFLTIPIGELLTNWEIDVISEGHNVFMQKTRNIQGTDLISSDVKIFNGSDNILEDLNHMLYVKGTSDNIKHGDNSTVKAELDALRSADAALDNKINLEIVRAQNKEEQLNDAIEAEAARATGEETNLSTTIGSGFTTDSHETVTYKFNELSERVSEGANTLQEEIERSTVKDTEQDGRLDAIEAEIGDGFGPRNTVADAIENEKQEREAKDAELQAAIDAVSADSASSIKDIINTDKSIDVDKTDTTKPVISVNISSEVEDGKQNIIKLNADGLYAGVDLSYEETANKLIFKTTNGSKEIQLESMSSIVNIEYNPTKEAIVITYLTNGHEIKTVEIPVGDLINEWRIWDGHEGAVQLEKIRVPSGTSEQDILKAAVVISDTHDDNILINDNGALYVSGKGISDNAAAIEAEVARAIAKENEIESALEDEVARATASENELDGKITSEKERAIARENEVATIVTNEITRAMSAETALQTAINNEEAARANADDTLTRNINDEVSRATAAENSITDNLNAEITRATTAENANTTAISTEVARATAKETEIEGNLANEVSRATEAENALNDAIDQLTDDTTYIVRSTNSVTLTKADEERGTSITADVNISDGNDNIIKVETDGLYATVDLNYDSTSNKLTFATTNGSKEIALVSNSIVNKIYYNASDETIVIEYTVNGQRMEDVIVPVRDLINEIDVDSTDTVELIKTPNTSTGSDIITANVKINSVHDDNILINDGGLYVSGAQIEANKAAIEELQESSSSASGEISELESALNAEITRATAAENATATAISTEVARATAKETEIEGNLANEVSRATAAESAVDAKVDAEITRSTNRDSELQNAITQEINNRETAVTAETVRATSAETALSTRITNEVTRATSEEARIEGKIDAEKARAEAAESALSDRIDEVDAKTFTLNVEDTTTVDLTYASDTLSANVVLANGESNIIKSSSNTADGSGLYATVDMEYNPATNKLKLITSALEKEFSLSTGSLLKSIEYDADAKNLIIKYDVNIGGVVHEEQVFVPVEDLFNDWTVQEGQHLGAIVLTKEEGTSGNPDILSAEIVISTLSDNMLINDQGSLYVSRRPIDDVSGQVQTLREDFEASLGTVDTQTLHLERTNENKLKGDVKISEDENNLIKVDRANDGIMFDGNIDCGTY